MSVDDLYAIVCALVAGLPTLGDFPLTTTISLISRQDSYTSKFVCDQSVVVSSLDTAGELSQKSYGGTLKSSRQESRPETASAAFIGSISHPNVQINCGHWFV